MRRLLPLLLAALVLAGCAGSPSARTTSTRLPDVSLASITGGKSVDLASLHGPVVVNLWASYCPPCKAELPRYQSFAQKYAGKVGVLGVDFQEPKPAAAQALLHRAGVRYPVVTDPEGHLRAMGLPKLLLVDAHGKVVYSEYVEITSVTQLERLVARHLGVKA
jgi:thiol-disulfide isomerase/thioredoxin